MKAKFKTLTGIFVLIYACSFCQTNKPVTNFLHIPAPISFLDKSYNLSWSSHPSAAYYKHEYITATDNPDRYAQMIMIEALVGDAKPFDLMSAKIAELKKMKETNPLVNYEMFQKNGEYILDFLVSDNAANGDINIIERNVYRYKAGEDKSGKKYVLLFGVSERAYGDKSQEFLLNLKKNKSVLSNAVAAFSIPSVSF